MNKKLHRLLLCVLIISICICFAVSSIYIQRLNDAITSTVIQNMDELSKHDLSNIQNMIDNTWSELNEAADRLKLYQIDKVYDLKYHLNIERTSSSFDTMYLLDSDGLLYTAGYIVVDGSEYSYVQKLMEEDREKLIMWYDDFDVVELKQETILYASKIEPLEVEGVTFVGIIGISNIRHMEDSMEISSFNGLGATDVIDRNGNYIVTGARSSDAATRNNFFDWFRRGTFEDGVTADDYIDRLENQESFNLTYVNADGVEKLLTFTPIPDTEWYLLVNIPTSILYRQAMPFVTVTLVLLLTVSFVILTLIFLVWKTQMSSQSVKALAQAKSEFLSNMSHEIRTPLNGLIGLNRLMKQNLDDREKIEDYLQKSDMTARYLRTLINDILDVSRLSEGHIELENNPFSLARMVDDIEVMFLDRMQEKDLNFQIEADIPFPNIVGDEVRLKQILINIIDNAVKYTPNRGSIIFRISQKDSFGVSSNITTHFEIEDTGCGMTKEFRQHIFDSFTREKNVLSHEGQGTGLGMTISHLLITKMGGTISVESELEKGSCFTVELPSGTTEDKEVEKLKQKKEETVLTPSKLNILVVEDIELNAEILMEILKAQGFSVEWAQNGKLALERFEASTPNEFPVILMDMKMPVMNGFDATRAIRALKRPDASTVKIIACTANTMPEDRERAIESGMDDFLAKPLDVDDLMEKLSIKQ